MSAETRNQSSFFDLVSGMARLPVLTRVTPADLDALDEQLRARLAGKPHLTAEEFFASRGWGPIRP